MGGGTFARTQIMHLSAHGFKRLGRCRADVRSPGRSGTPVPAAVAADPGSSGRTAQALTTSLLGGQGAGWASSAVHGYDTRGPGKAARTRRPKRRSRDPRNRGCHNPRAHRGHHHARACAHGSDRGPPPQRRSCRRCHSRQGGARALRAQGERRLRRAGAEFPGRPSRGSGGLLRPPSAGEPANSQRPLEDRLLDPARRAAVTRLLDP